MPWQEKSVLHKGQTFYLRQHSPVSYLTRQSPGITRGKRLVVLVGQKRALAMAINGKQTERRWSKLSEWLHI
jgi:hypothetical protein